MSPIKSSRLKARESAQRYSHRRSAAELVRQRWEKGGLKCEGCGLVVDVIECAHLFGRGRTVISEPWASDPTLCAALCCARSWGDRIGCHESLDRGLAPNFAAVLRQTAVVNFATRHDIPPGSWYITAINGDPADALRAIERVLISRRDEGAERLLGESR